MAYSIVTLSDMIDAFDKEQPKPGRETTTFIKRWKLKEMEEKHRTHAYLVEAVRGINRAEIQNIRETKKFRDEQKKLLAEGKKEGGHRGGKTTQKRRMIRDGTFAVERGGVMKVYLVSKGCYSDFTIIGAFSTLEKAKDAVDYFNANEGIDEYEIDSEAKQRPAGMKAFRVAMDREGNVIVDEWNHKQVIHECSGSYADDNTVFGYGGYRETPTHASFHVWAKDEEHAIKIANEKRGAVLIADEWPK